MKFILVLLLTIPLFVYGAERNLSLKDLSGTEWEWHKGNTADWPLFTFRFMNDGSLKFLNASYGFDEGGYTFNGTYKVVKDELLLVYQTYSFYDKENDPDYKPETFEARGLLKRNVNSVQYNTEIIFGSFTIVCRDSMVKEGEVRTVDGVEVVTTGGMSAVVSKNAKIRIKPDVKSQFIYFGVEPGSDGLAYCPAGKELKILARTKDRVKLEKWNNFWYYAELTSAGELGARYGWIYGEFLNFK